MRLTSDRLVVGAVLAALTLVLAFQRAHTYDEPLERDITTYAVIGHEALGGRALYADLWDNKSPLVYATYALAEIAAGYGPGAIFLLGVGIATATLLGVFRVAALLAGSASAGLWAAAFWTAVSADRALQANQPNLEVFMSAALVWVLAGWLAPRPRPLLIGALGALATLYKLVVLPTIVLWLVVHVVAARAAGRPLRRALRESALAAATMLAVWGAVAGYFAATGRTALLHEAVIVYNQSFAGDLVHNLLASLAPLHLAPGWVRCVAAFAPLALVGVTWLVRARHWYGALLWISYALGTQVAVALPGKFYPHYYQLWLPVLAVGAALGVHGIGQLKWRRPPSLAAHWPTVGATLGVAVLLVSMWIEIPAYAHSADDWSRAKYGDVFVDAKRLATDIDAALAPGETFFEWGDETELYYYSHRHPPTGLFYVFPMIVTAPLRTALATRVLRDLERAPPELLVVNAAYLYAGMATHPVSRWFTDRYYHWDDGPERGRFRLFVRRDGALAARLAARPAR